MIHKPRNKAHVQRMARKRAMQLARTANCSPFGRKLVWTPMRMPDGTTKRVQVGVERTDEQGDYRAKHWNKEQAHG